ncbi:ribonuclease T2-like protein, partial [Pisolithus tinctorius]
LQYCCENTNVLANSCCNVVKGRLVLQTQYWDTYTGLEDYGHLLPRGSWTIHGLWPSNLFISYNQYRNLTKRCDSDLSPSDLPVGTTVPPVFPPEECRSSESGVQDFPSVVETFWINQGVPNEDLWAHEFSKHVTCTSTFEVACYEPDYKEHQDVV